MNTALRSDIKGCELAPFDTLAWGNIHQNLCTNTIKSLLFLQCEIPIKREGEGSYWKKMQAAD